MSCIADALFRGGGWASTWAPQEYLKQTQREAPEHPDVMLVQQALDRVKEAATHINEVIRQRENKERVIQVGEQPSHRQWRSRRSRAMGEPRCGPNVRAQSERAVCPPLLRLSDVLCASAAVVSVGGVPVPHVHRPAAGQGGAAAQAVPQEAQDVPVRAAQVSQDLGYRDILQSCKVSLLLRLNNPASCT